MYAVKEILNYDPEALAKKSDESNAALENSEQYEELTKKRDSLSTSATLCMVGCFIFFICAMWLPWLRNVNPFYTAIPLLFFFAFAMATRKAISKREEIGKERDDVYWNYTSFATAYYDAVGSDRVLALYGRQDEDDEDVFKLTLITCPKGDEEKDDVAIEHTLYFPIDKATLPYADYDNLVLDVGNDTLYFKKAAGAE